MPRARTWCAPVVLAAIGLSGRVVVGEPEGSAVVIIDSGSTDIFVESMVRTVTETSLVKEGYQIVEGVSVAGETPDRLLACAGEPLCTRDALAEIPADWVFFLSLRDEEEDDSSSRNLKIVGRSYLVRTGESRSRTMHRCPQCIEDVELATFTEGVVHELVENTKTPPATPTEKEPVIQQSPEPGIAGALTQRPHLPPPPSHSILPWLGIGAGSLALGTGTALLLLDGPVIEDGVRRPEAYETTNMGLAVVSAGAVLIGASIFVLATRDDEGIRPTVSASREQGTVGLAGEF